MSKRDDAVAAVFAKLEDFYGVIACDYEAVAVVDVVIEMLLNDHVHIFTTGTQEVRLVVGDDPALFSHTEYRVECSLCDRPFTDWTTDPALAWQQHEALVRDQVAQRRLNGLTS